MTREELHEKLIAFGEVYISYSSIGMAPPADDRDEAERRGVARRELKRQMDEIEADIMYEG